jgi:hypothetical protein
MRSRAIDEHKKTLRLSDEQREVLVGILLGDACLETQNSGRTFRLKIEQSAQHQAYVQHLYSLFRPWVLTPPRERQSTAANGSVTRSWAFNTVSHEAFRFYAHQFYGDGVKQVPRLIQRWLTPRGLAYWFMDDGSMKSHQSKGVIFNTQGFSGPDVERLIGVLQSKLALQAKLRHQDDGWQIYVSGSSYEDFMNLVGAHVIAEMRHKLPQARRTRLPKR